MITRICQLLHISERRACRVLGQPGATQRRLPRMGAEEGRLTTRIIELATKYGRYGYRRITSQDVIDQLFQLFVLRGIPEHIRSDNGPEFTAREIRKWLARMGVKTFFIERGSPWENGYIESFNGKLRDELLD